MAQKDHNDLADALAALAAGDHVEPDAEHGEEHEQAAPAPAPPPAPAAKPKSASGLRPPAAHAPAAAATPRSGAPIPVGRPATPGAAGTPRPRSAAPTPVPQPPSKARPAAPAAPVAQGRPAAPAQSGAAPVVRPGSGSVRPAAPAAPPPSRSGRPPGPVVAAPPPPPVQEAFVVDEQPVYAEESGTSEGGDWVGTAPVDDDAMMAPAVDPSMLAHMPVSHHSHPTQRFKTSDTKRTMIPILLTTGVLMLVFAGLTFVMGPESAFATLPIWVVAMLGGTGVVLLGGAVFTMLQVKDQMARAAAGTPAHR